MPVKMGRVRWMPRPKIVSRATGKRNAISQMSHTLSGLSTGLLPYSLGSRSGSFSSCLLRRDFLCGDFGLRRGTRTGGSLGQW